MEEQASNSVGDLEAQLRQTDWSQFLTAYGVATDVPGQLIRLLSGDHADAMHASHALWCGLCHQHAYVSSAAIPALPFLIRALDLRDDKLKIEILDILIGFAVCTGGDGVKEWERELRQSLLQESERFRMLVASPDYGVADWAKVLCRTLEVLPKEQS